MLNNQLTGAFGYGMAISSASNFTVQGNILVGNTSFIGSNGPNCSTTDITPTPAPFVQDENTVTSSSIQDGFQHIPDGDSLTCIMPPDGGDYWPFGGNPSGTGTGTSPTSEASPTASASGSSSHGGLSGGAKAGIAIGVILGVAALAVATYFVRNWAVKRARATGGRY